MKQFILYIFFLLIIIVILFASCSKKIENVSKNDLKDSLMNIDKEFSKLSESKSSEEAFLSYAAKDVIIIREGQYPIISVDSLKKSYDRRTKTKSILTWVPLKADVSGDLGYTFGIWDLKTLSSNGNDTNQTGIYYTFWKKQADGSWKFVIDGGTTTPSKFVF